MVVHPGVLAVALAAEPVARRHRLDRAAVDAVAHDDRAERALDRRLHGLRVAPGLLERVDVEVGHRVAHVRDRVARVRRGLGEVEREQEVPAELGLDVHLDVLELEAAHAGDVRLRALGREAERAVDAVGVVERVAVRDVELRRQVRVEPVAGDVPHLVVLVERLVGDRRLGVVTGERLEDRVVGRRRVLLEAVRPQQQLGRRVVVLLEGEVDPVLQALDRRRLGLGVRARAAIGLGGGVVGRALLVEAPVRREVPVRVDAVAQRPHAVVVVVAHVLAPQAVAGRERELVAVRVGDADEPQLARVDERRDGLGRDVRDRVAVVVDRRARLAVVVDEEVERPPAGLAREPLARVLHGVVEDGRPRAVRGRLGVLGDLQRPDVAAEVGLAERLLLDDRQRLERVVLLDVLLLAVRPRHRCASRRRKWRHCRPAARGPPTPRPTRPACAACRRRGPSCPSSRSAPIWDAVA